MFCTNTATLAIWNYYIKYMLSSGFVVFAWKVPGKICRTLYKDMTISLIALLTSIVFMTLALSWWQSPHAIIVVINDNMTCNFLYRRQSIGTLNNVKEQCSWSYFHIPAFHFFPGCVDSPGSSSFACLHWVPRVFIDFVSFDNDSFVPFSVLANIEDR